VSALSGRPGPEALIAAMPGGMIMLDPGGCIAGLNAAAEMLLNASGSQMMHKPLGLVLRLPDACVAGLSDEKTFAAYGVMLDRPPMRGGPITVDFHATPLTDHDGWRLVMLNIVPATSALDPRRSGTRAAIGAAAMLAHEIKNPLAGIRGAAQLLDSAVDEQGRALTRLIRDEVDRVAGLIDRMEAFTDDRPAQPRAENIYAILDHVRALAMSGFGDRIEIRDAFDPSLPLVLVDRDALIQIILNLLKNASEAVGENRRGTIWLTTAYRHGVMVPVGEGQRRALPIELAVIDDGPGPPPELVDHLFDPFVSSKASGRGLGLALVDKLMRDMGGMVRFAREGTPERTIFRLLLPRAD
jgi:two-component system, NtrC family, nitrogen regulation sensor histidine kinase GlnL